MPGWLIAASIGLVGFALGAIAALIAGRGRAPRREEPAPTPVEIVVDSGEEERLDARPLRDAAVSALLGQALREPVRKLRRSEAAGELIESFERVAWQARMLASRPRPMKAAPISPEGLIQQAVEEVEALRLGKVVISWSVLTRRPITVDRERTVGALRELLDAAAHAAGEGGRVGIRIRDSERSSYPVDVEIEIGRRGAEFDPLHTTVAHHLLTGQAAEFEVDGPTVRVHFKVGA